MIKKNPTFVLTPDSIGIVGNLVNEEESENNLVMGNSPSLRPQRELPALPPDPTQLRYLVLSIGSIRGLAFLGALEEFKRMNLRRWKGAAGVSVGAIVALYVALDLPLSGLRDLFRRHMLVKRAMRASVKVSCGRLSIISNRALCGALTEMLASRGLEDTTTFAELATVTDGFDLRVFAWSIKDKADECFSAHATPETSVLKAVMASAAMDIVFAPQEMPDGKCYTDGGRSIILPFDKLPLGPACGALFGRFASVQGASGCVVRPDDS